MVADTGTADEEQIEIVDPLIITRDDVLEVIDRVLRREAPLGEAFLFAIDVVDSNKDGTAKLEDPTMLPPLEELAKMPAITFDILEEIRGRFRKPHETGSA